MNLYFDNASTSFPKPPAVGEAIEAYLASEGGSAGRGAYGRGFAAGAIVERCRDAMAGVMGIAAADHLFFTSGATAGANWVVQGLLREAGARVLTSPMEHNAVVRPLHAVGAVTESLPCDGDGVVDVALLGMVDCKGVELVVINHVSNVNGAVQPVAEICAWAKDRELAVMVDTSQSAGHIDVKGDAWGADYLIFTGHKGLCGPTGIGGFYARRPGTIIPLMYGGTGSYSDSYSMPDCYPERFEAGTHNVVGAAGLLAAIEHPLQKKHGRDDFEMLVQRIADIDGVMVYGSRAGAELFSITHISIDAASLCERLYREAGIETRSGLHCAPLAHGTLGTLSTGTVRISLSAAHERVDLEALYGAVVNICRC